MNTMENELYILDSKILKKMTKEWLGILQMLIST